MWAAEIGVDLLDSRFAVRSDDAGVVAEVARLFGASAGPRRPVRGKHLYSVETAGDELVLYEDCSLLSRSPDRKVLLSHLVGRINGAVIDEARCFAMHSGVVAIAGAAIALPGVSGAGKSTLTAALVQAGAKYVSDEALSVPYDSSKAVRPYLKPIALHRDSAALLGVAHPGDASEVLVTPADLGGAAVDPGDRLPLGAVLLLTRRPGPVELVPAHRAAAMKVLLEMSFNHYRRPHDAFALAAELARGASVWSLAYESALDAATTVRGHFGAQTA